MTKYCSTTNILSPRKLPAIRYMHTANKVFRLIKASSSRCGTLRRYDISEVQEVFDAPDHAHSLFSRSKFNSATHKVLTPGISPPGHPSCRRDAWSYHFMCCAIEHEPNQTVQIRLLAAIKSSVHACAAWLT